jgi:regulator of sigma E protease
MGILSSVPGVALIILGFGVLIFVHELGHFLAAKWAGIRTEGFAVGMGPVMVAWRHGIGFAPGSTERRVVARTGKSASDLTDDELAHHGIGETEYSLRWLPIGGFVKMLGQDDLNPGDRSKNSRSYTVCPVGKRMVVVSAGVVMNVILALVLFMIAFLAGVRFEAPVIGDVSPILPAGTTMAENAEQLGVTVPGFQAGDVVTHIDGDEARTFADLQIASAMGRPTVPIGFTVERRGVPEPLRFRMAPVVDPGTGLLSIGVAPAMSTTLVGADDDLAAVDRLLARSGLDAAGVRAGMRVATVGGADVETYEQFQSGIAAGRGAAVPTVWHALDEAGARTGPAVDVAIEAVPAFEPLLYPELAPDGKRDFELGLLGLTPLTRIARVLDDSPNVDVLRTDDLILGVGPLEGPRLQMIKQHVSANAGTIVAMTVLRDGVVQDVKAIISRRGRLGIELSYAWDVPMTAEPFERVALPPTDGAAGEVVATPFGPLALSALTRLRAVGDTPAADWAMLRSGLRALTADARAAGRGAEVPVTVAGTDDVERTVTLTLSADDVTRLHDLGWHADLPAFAFEPVYTTLSADGSPVRAMVMGFHETHKMIMMTYLTIDRLFRGTVGVEQLRGPVGIIDLGAKILPKGFMFFLFFLGMISVNLAVLNFLPLPIVDGGLFLFLVYEKLKGRPPSVQFQNIATIAGLFLIGTVFVVMFYNDIARLIP